MVGLTKSKVWKYFSNFSLMLLVYNDFEYQSLATAENIKHAESLERTL